MSSINRAGVQAFGGFLTAMVIPNMGAFIAWGFITALFIPTGWFPNEHLGKLVGPMITYYLPLLLAYNGGELIYGKRGGVAGTIGAIGLIIGSSIPMFLGAMVVGPLGGWIIKKFDKAIENKIPAGFEMVVSNFSLGIIGLGLCLSSYTTIGPMIEEANSFVTMLINRLVSTGALPILSLINEPAKVLFLNNVIDQGVYYPLGMQEALTNGKSIFFMVASNPGSGLGLLIAYALFGKGDSKKSAGGAMVIHFLGGIHEIYFPYVLMKPIMIVAMILGGASGTLTFMIFDVGLVAGPSPGSIFSYLALTPRGNFLGVISGVAVACAVSFIVSSFILKVSKSNEDEAFKESVAKSKDMKQEGKTLLQKSLKTSDDLIKFVAFACDAGLGSSAMGATLFKKALLKSGIDIQVKNFAIESVPEEADVIVTHKNLLERARLAFPSKRIVTIESFTSDANISELLDEIKNQAK